MLALPISTLSFSRERLTPLEFSLRLSKTGKRLSLTVDRRIGTTADLKVAETKALGNET